MDPRRTHIRASDVVRQRSADSLPVRAVRLTCSAGRPCTVDRPWTWPTSTTPCRSRPSPSARSSPGTPPGCWSTEGPGTPPSHRTVADLPELLEPGDLLVVNDTRVRRARLRLHKPSGGAVEVLLVDRRPDGTLGGAGPPQPQGGPGTDASPATGVEVLVGDDLGEAAVSSRSSPATRRRPARCRCRRTSTSRSPTRSATRRCTHGGRRRRRRRPRACTSPTPCSTAAAPGASTSPPVELVVGLDTFRPISTATVEEHVMHSERVRRAAVDVDAVRLVQRGRVVAVGTTVVRAAGVGVDDRRARRVGPTC